MPLQCLSRVRFGSFLAYSPRGQSEESKKSKRITLDIKRAKSGYIEYVVQRLHEEMAPGHPASILHDVLGRDVLVVPCPRSTPLVPGGLWTPKEICDVLVAKGLAYKTAPILRRTQAVATSHTARSGERPKPAEHIRTMAVASQLEFTQQRITIVDDVITRGATLIAAATHIHDCFPGATVKVFGVVRTKSYEPEVGKILDPVLGEIEFNGSDANRNP